LLVVGAMAVIRHAKPGSKIASDWLLGLLERRPRKVAAVALANKMARIAWAMMPNDTAYRRKPWSPDRSSPPRDKRAIVRDGKRSNRRARYPVWYTGESTPPKCLGLVRRNPSGPAIICAASSRGRTHDRTRSVCQIKQKVLASLGSFHTCTTESAISRLLWRRKSVPVLLSPLSAYCWPRDGTE
jgi:hypothetical protein